MAVGDQKGGQPNSAVRRSQEVDQLFRQSNAVPLKLIVGAGASDPPTFSNWSPKFANVWNNTDRWVYLPDALVYVAPKQYIGKIPIPPGVQQGQALFQAPPTVAQGASTPGQICTIWFYEEDPGGPTVIGYGDIQA